MSSFGVLSTGFALKTTQDIKSDLEAGERAAFGSDFDVSADSVAGQINGVVAGAIGEGWEVLQSVYRSQDPNQASGQALDQVSAITRTIRLAAQRSTTTLTLTGTPLTNVPQNATASHVTSQEQFTTDALGTITAVAAWAPTTAYAIGDRVNNSGNVYQATIAGTSAGAGGPTGTDPDTLEVDGTVTWQFMGVGTGAIDVAATSVNFGPIAAPSGAIRVIETPISGWNGVRNQLDAALGRNLETDADMRVRREAELRNQGASNVDAIRAALLALRINGVQVVTQAFVFENVSEFTDADGRPPHSLEAVVDLTNPADTSIQDAVAQAIWDNKPAGIQTFGFPGQVVTRTVVDDSGTSQSASFSTVATLDIHIEIDVTTNPGPTGALYPIDGDAQVSQIIVDTGNTLLVGEGVIAEKIKCSAFQVSGVIDITAFRIDTITPPVGTTNIAVNPRQRAVFDNSRVTVTSV